MWHRGRSELHWGVASVTDLEVVTGGQDSCAPPGSRLCGQWKREGPAWPDAAKQPCVQEDEGRDAGTGPMSPYFDCAVYHR